MGVREPLTRLLELMEIAGPSGWLDLNNPEVMKCYRELYVIVDTHQPQQPAAPAEPGVHVSSDGRRWVVRPDDEPGNPGNCRSCGAGILWVKRMIKASNTVKPHPLDPDGTSHFKTCPDAKEWSKR